MLIDSHCHLPDKKYKKSPAEIVAEAKSAGVEKMIAVGTSLQGSRETLETAREFEEVYCAVGVYPHEDLERPLGEIHEKLRKILNSSRKDLVGLGECGLDIPEGDVPYKTRPLPEQKELFKLQLGLAVERGLPIVIHNRNADEEILKILEKYQNTKLKGVAHCYVSDWEFAKKLLHLNIMISFSGIITYPSAGKALLDAVKKVPESSFLVETDAPWLPPQGHRGEVNYPKYVKITAAKIAEIRNSSPERIAELSYKNTCNLFNL